MLWKESIRQTRFLLKQREAVLTLTVLFWIVIWNYLKNVLEFQGMDITRMYHPMKLLALSYNRINNDADTTILVTMLYPLLVTLAAGMSYVKEQQTQEEIFLITRLGQRRYMLSKLFSVFLATTIVFCIPFLTEMAMNCISFPMKAQGDLTNLSIYSEEYAGMVYRYQAGELYIVSPVLYAVLGIFIFGIFSGLLAAFATAVSLVFRVKYRVLLFLPAYLLLNATTFINQIFPEESVQISWYEYLLFFNDNEKFPWYLPAAAAVLLLLTTGLYQIGKRQERYG